MHHIAVIGLGNIANRHRKNIKRLFPKSVIYAMPSSQRKVVERIQDADEVIYSIDYLINNVEMAIIASPASFHSKHALAFIKAGIPVLIEKPVTASLEDAVELVEVYSKYKTPIAIGYCLRYLPSAQKVNKILQQQIIGELINATISVGQYLPDWRVAKNYKESVSANKALGGGALLELSHELDYAKWLLGELKLQNAIVRNSGSLDIDVEDLVDVVATTQGNAVLHIHLDFLQRMAHRKCEFIGLKGRLEWDLIANEIILYNENGKTIIYRDQQYDKNNMYLDMLTDFCRLISGKENNCVQLNEAISTVEFIENIRRAAK